MREKQTKPRKVDKKYRRYDPVNMDQAYKAVREKGIPVQRAARTYGVPEQTLRDRVKGFVNHFSAKQGGETCFSHEEEVVLMEHLKTMAQLGYGFTNTQLQHTAGELAFDMGKKKNNKPMSNCWLYGFMKRWNGQLASLKPRKLDSNRARSTTPENITEYYRNLKDIFDKYNFHVKPHLIYNVDETGLQPEHRPPNVIAPPNTKPQAITSPRSTTTTVIACANAVGNSIPPYFVFKGKRFNSDLMKGATPGASCTMSDSGWSNGTIFRQYLEQHFLHHVKGQIHSDEYVLLICDGHGSHINGPLIDWAKKNHIIMFVLPSHTSHLLQPLDVSNFGPFKAFYNAECSLFMKNHIGQNITKYDMCQIACKSYIKAMTPFIIMSGFRKTGIYPFSSEAVPMEKLVPCESFREDHPVEKVKAMKSGKEAVEKFLLMKSEKIESLKRKETKGCENCCGQQKSGTIGKPKAGGRAITDDSFITELTNYEHSKENRTHTKQSSCSIEPTNKKKKTTSTANNSRIPLSPMPSTSGLNIPPKTNTEDESDFEEEMNDKDVCCVCKKFYAPKEKDFPYLKIINWGQCVRCDHWVHLTLCTDVHVVRRHSDFLCPHCKE